MEITDSFRVSTPIDATWKVILDIEGIAVHETKAQTPLIVDTDAPISHSIMLQWLQSVRRRDAQIFDSDRTVQLRQPHCRTGLARNRKATPLPRCINTFRFGIREDWYKSAYTKAC